MLSRNVHLRGMTLVFLCSFLVTGCHSGPELIDVSGQVLLDDEPLENAIVKFIPEAGGRQSVAKTDQDGRFRLRFTQGRYGALPGIHRVMITSALPATTDVDGNPDSPGRPELLDKKYNEETELRADVRRNNRNIQFFLTSK